ncbi:MAG: RNA polymerase sigma factor [Patescibacteria group bacterium]|nr:RNA polymerase sigma factor [Patescibacteria group bacterium]
MADKKSPEELNMLAEKAKTSSTAFGELYEYYIKRIYAFNYHRTNNSQAVAEDLTSQTFEKIVKNIHKYDSKRTNFSTWIYSITQNNLIDYYRRQNRKKTNSLDSTTEGFLEKARCNQGNKSLDQSVSNERNQRILNLALLKLKPRDQLVLTLRFSQNLTYQEIGSIMRSNTGTVGVRIHRALKKLGTVLRKHKLDVMLDL